MCGLQEEAGTAAWHNAPPIPCYPHPSQQSRPTLVLEPGWFRQEGVESAELSVTCLDPQPRPPLQGGTHGE